MVTIKKYSNRRLYDTSTSSYITLEELADKIRDGTDVRVIHAKTDEDITQQILAQIILESRGAARLLPVPLLMRLIRMGEDRLAEFFGQFMSWSLELYLRFKEGAETMAPFNPLSGSSGSGGLGGAEVFWRMFMGQTPWPNGESPWEGGEVSSEPRDEVGEAAPAVEEPERQDGDGPEDVDALRREVAELKEMLRGLQQAEGDEQ